jgi:hypothetical protein
MSFQSVIRFRQTDGFLGQTIRDVPSVVKVWRLSEQATVPNVFGRAYTNVIAEFPGQNGLPSIPVAEIGAADVANKFAGILCNPEQHALAGSTAGTLAPSLELPANTAAQLMTKGEVVVSFSTPVVYGDPVYFDDTTGALFNAAATGRTLIANAKVERTTTAAGLTPISLGE